MKNYLIIGASSGIGQALARQLAEEGHKVYATYCKNPVEQANGIIYNHLDVMEDELDFNYLPEQLDGIAYCPGSILLKPFSRIKPASFMVDYNLQVVGAVKVLQSVLSRLKKSAGAGIVLFSTVAVQKGFTFHAQVAASKGAIEGLTRALAAELAPKIRVNAIAPSLTQTPLAGKLLSTEEKIQANANRHPLKRIGQPEDAANLAAFLLSDKSSWISGQIFHVDGGKSSIAM